MRRPWLLAVSLLLVVAALYGCQHREDVAWSFATPRPWFLAGDSQVLTPTVEDNVVFFCGGYPEKNSAETYALDVQTGKLKWRHNVGGCVASPVISAETVVAFGTGEHGGSIVVHGLDRISGRERWKAELPGNPSPPAPVQVGDFVFFAPGSRSVLRIDARDGTVQSFDIDADVSLPSEVVWVTGTPDEAIFGYGESAWHERIGHDAPEAGTPLSEVAGQPAGLASDGRMLLVADGEGDLRAFDLEKGSVMWRRHWSKILSAPTLAGGRIFLNVYEEKAMLVALAPASGAELWRIPEGGTAAPYWQSGRLYQSSGAGVLVVDAASGKVKSRLAARTLVTTTPVPIGGLLLFGTVDGVLSAARVP